jgi:hypothetical protein
MSREKVMCRYVDNGKTLEVYCTGCNHNLRLSLPIPVPTLVALTETFSAEHRNSCPTDANRKVRVTP